MRAMSEDLTGQQFGDLFVVGRSLAPRPKIGGRPFWTCSCACGRTRDLLTTNLKKMQSCGCKHGSRIAAARTKTPGNPARNRLVRHYKRGALDRNLPFALTSVGV